MIRVFLLDDHEVVRRGVGAAVDAEADMTVVGEADDAHDIVTIIGECRPDVAVLDVRLGSGAGSGISVCAQIRDAFPDVKSLILTSFLNDPALVEASIAGAAGFILKQIRSNDLIEAIRAVAGGATLFDDEAVREARQRLHEGAEGRLSVLSPQEFRIFELIGEGLTNRQIAREMYLAEKTIKNYVSSLLSKLGMSRRTEAAALSARLDERRVLDT